MRRHRHLERVSGEAEVIASRAALRLACGGDIVEPVCATEFIWRPQPAERRLFRCPASVRVVVLPGGDEHCTAVFEWSGGRWPWSWGLLGALAGGVALFFAPAGWPVWQKACAAIPLVMGLLAPKVMESDWASRIGAAVRAGAVPFLNGWPEAAAWLELEADDRNKATARVAEMAANEGGAVVRPGVDRRSAARFLGWPIWHVCSGLDPLTGLPRQARGWYARGDQALGLVAVGSFAHGWLAVGFFAVGLLAIGMCAAGAFVAFGIAAVGGVLCVGEWAAGLAAYGFYALGVFATSRLHHGTITILLFLGSMVSFFLFLFATGWIRRHFHQAALREHIAGRLESRAVADEASLSRVPRLTGESAERGLSQVRGED
jgi:hypothetical protein